MKSNDALPIQVKASREGFTLVPHPTVPFEAILEYMRKRLEESRDFFHHSEMILDLRSRPLRTDEITALNELLVKHSRGRLVEVKLAGDVAFALNRGVQDQSAASEAHTAVRKDAEPIIVRSTCRSGVRVVSSSDCVVLGDVNPGAEIIAAGDIIVFGNLRGVAHAGATGDRTARIWALSIQPNQLRIADLVAVPPRGQRSVSRKYELAEIRDDLIEVSTP